MSRDSAFDHWYAAKNVKILMSPTHQLETFGSTLMNYHLISELDDFPGKIRIREGRLEAHPPLVIMPNVDEITVEGLGTEAKEYLDFLKENEEDLRILQYGFHLKSDRFSEQIVTDSLDAVIERVKVSVSDSNDKFAAVLVGVDSPWDVALVELWRREVARSARKNIKELEASGKLFGKG